MTNTTTTKFTATLVTESDKNAIVALRNESNLSEKELMTLVIANAVTNKQVILEQAKVVLANNHAARTVRKQEAYQALKAKLQETRQAKKQDKPSKGTKPVKASGVAVAA
jgi:transcriptional regulator of acetoin/glycerol metabolism